MARLLLALSCILPLTVSCATTTTPLDRTPEGEWGGRTNIDLMVRVQNDHYEPVRISVVWEHMDYYLGEITPGSTEVFRVPGYLLESQGGPKFLANPRGSAQEHLTARVDCERARWVEWRLKRNLHQSRPYIL